MTTVLPAQRQLMQSARRTRSGTLYSQRFLPNCVLQVFYSLAQIYALNHAFMHTGHCPCHPEPLPLGNYRDEEIEVQLLRKRENAANTGFL